MFGTVVGVAGLAAIFDALRPEVSEVCVDPVDGAGPRAVQHQMRDQIRDEIRDEIRHQPPARAPAVETSPPSVAERPARATRARKNKLNLPAGPDCTLGAPW